MNKRNLVLGGFLVIVLIAALLVSASNTRTLATESDPPSNERQISQPVVEFTGGGKYSGDDLYDPSINKSLLATQNSQAANEQQISQSVTKFTAGGGYSGDDLYDPSINESLLATQQACVANNHGDDSYQPAVALNCNTQDE